MADQRGGGRSTVAGAAGPSVADVVLAHVYRMNDVDWLGAYGESNVSVGCRLPGADIAGSYSPYLFLSSDVGVAHGREVHGQPKKLGEPRLEIRGDLTVGAVSRNGIDVLTGTMPTKQWPDSIDSLTRHFDFALNINLKSVDHIDGRPAIRQLTARRLADVTVHECWGGPPPPNCAPTLRPRSTAFLSSKCSTASTGAPTSRLCSGRIIHDYLAART